MALIRAATEADLPRLVELYFQLAQLGERPGTELEPVSEAQRTAFRSLQARPGSTCFVIEQDDHVQGTFTLYVLPSVSHNGRSFGLIENVVVDAAAQGSGLGRQLMEYAEAAAREGGCYKVAFTSNQKRTDAHGFYEHLGFSPTHRGYSKYFD